MTYGVRIVIMKMMENHFNTRKYVYMKKETIIEKPPTHREQIFEKIMELSTSIRIYLDEQVMKADIVRKSKCELDLKKAHIGMTWKYGTEKLSIQQIEWKITTDEDVKILTEKYIGDQRNLDQITAKVDATRYELRAMEYAAKMLAPGEENFK